MKPPSTKATANSVTQEAGQDLEKGTHCPSNPAGGDGAVSPKRDKKLGGWSSSCDYLWDLLGKKTADELVRDAHLQLKCKYCGEAIGELKDNTRSYGWMHIPFGASYTYCKADSTGNELKEMKEATPKDDYSV